MVALHLVLLLYFAPPQVMLSKQPVLMADYALHTYQIERAREAFKGWGALWGYDPQQLAGQPAGVVEDLTSKGTELFVIGAGRLGIDPVLAFNLFILLVHLSVPFAAYGAARLFKLGKGESVTVALLWVLMWFFDSFMHWCWWVGMITWSVACLLCVLLVGLLWRALEEQRVVWLLLVGLVAAAITLIHPFGVFAVLVPVVALYARAFKNLTRRTHALLWLGAVAAASTTLVWIHPTWYYRHYIGDVDVFFRPRLPYVLYDALDLMKDARNTGAPVRTLFRTLCFVAGGVGLWRWRKAGDRRTLALASFVVADVLVAYLSGYVWAARQTQPYRQIGPAMLAAAIPAAVVLRESLALSTLRQFGKSARLVLALALVLIVPRVARTALYFIPDLLPHIKINGKDDWFTSSLVGVNEPYPVPRRHEGPPPRYVAVRDWLAQHAANDGRVVVLEWPLGEYLAASTRLPILGGIRERNVPHVDANLFRIAPTGVMPGDALRQYFVRYAVGYVVMAGDYGPLDYRRDLLEPAKSIQGTRIYKTRIKPDYFLRGSGRIASQHLNSIHVVDARPDPSTHDVVVRFHWMEPLRCRPDCKVERFRVDHDRVGFIRIPDPPPGFEIYNAYVY